MSTFRDAPGLLPTPAVRKMQTCTLVHRVLAQQKLQCLFEIFLTRKEVSLHNTREDNHLHFPKVRLELGKRGLFYFGPTIFSDLPVDFKLLAPTAFKRKLKTIIFLITCFLIRCI